MNGLTGKSADLKPGQVLVFTRKEEPYKYDTIQFEIRSAVSQNIRKIHKEDMVGNHECNI